MVIHSPHESAVCSEHAFDLGCMFKLELLVYVPLVLHWPPCTDTFVYLCSIGPELGARFHLSEQEIPRVMSLYRCAWNDIVCELARTFLLGHEKRHIFEVCL